MTVPIPGNQGLNSDFYIHICSNSRSQGGEHFKLSDLILKKGHAVVVHYEVYTWKNRSPLLSFFNCFFVYNFTDTFYKHPVSIQLILLLYL